MKREDFRFFHRLRVRWAEVGMRKAVFNDMMYVDAAVAEYWRMLALPYDDAMQLLGSDTCVKNATLEFHACARMDDCLDVALKCSRIGNSSMDFSAAIFRGDELLIGCELVYVFADPATQTSMPVPPRLRDVLSGYEAGEPMVNVRTGSWPELGEDAKRIRTEVFVGEQRIPADMEWDDGDSAALHAVAYNRLGQAIATGRLLQERAGVARIGRVAVRRALRGSGVGRQLMHTLLELGAARGDREAVLHAQRSSEGFYRGLGFSARGEPFDEAGIAHIEMARPLIAA